jgi:AcrR family transcriptional regulator
MDLAEGLLQDNGYNGFSYAHIADALGIKNAAVHYHFPTKDGLVCAVLKRYRDRFQLWTNNARIKDLSYAKKLDWFFGIYSDYRADDGKVCLAGSLEAEFNTLPEAVRTETRALNAEMLAWLEVALAEGKAAGEFQFNGSAKDKAGMILASLQGGLQIARALGAARFQGVVRQHRQDILA